MSKHSTLTLIVLLMFTYMIQAQTHVNREWIIDGGHPVNTDIVNSLVSSPNDIIRVGNVNAGSEGANLFVTKYNKYGDTLWQYEYHTTGSNNDYGTALTIDGSGNVFVCGVTDNGTSDNFGILLLKFNSSGTLLWHKKYDSPYHKNDIAVALKADGLGNVYVLGNSEGSTTMMDILILKYTSAGSLLHADRYNYLSLPDIGIDIHIDSGNARFLVAGTSAKTLNEWEYIILSFDSSGTLTNERRDSIPGYGINQPYAFAKDPIGNFYLTGKASSNGTNYDIRTIKVDTAHNITWSPVINGTGNGTDAGLCIAMDANSDAIVGGFTTNANGKKEIIVVKYSNSSGTELWRHSQSAKDQSGDAFAKAVAVNGQNEIYVLSEEKANGKNQAIVSKFTPSGALVWERKLEGNSVKERPTNIHIAADASIYVTSIRDTGSLAEYQLARFTEFTQNDEVETDSLNEPTYKARDLIVRFKEGALDTALINDTRKEFYYLKDFLTAAARDTFYAHLDSNQVNRYMAIKIFKNLTTHHKTTVSRLGETIPIPDFYNALLVEFPNGTNLVSMSSTLNSMESIIAYTDINVILSLDAGSNDAFYGSQFSLMSTTYPNAHINVEEAWDVLPNGGVKTVKCGVYDTGIDWQHEDFGYDGITPSSSKIVEVWDFRSNTSLKPAIAEADSNGHGTASAGVVGAIRNNNMGIAGIAGGNYVGASNHNDDGIALYGMKITSPGLPFLIPHAVDGIVMGATDNSSLSNAYGLHLMSNSWGKNPLSISEDTLRLLREAVHFANRANVTFVASRGNFILDAPHYPATMHDDWVISVGGTGYNGNYESSAGYGSNVDVAAPNISGLVQSTYQLSTYGGYSGTSAACPHVSGVVGLLMSMHNSPVNSYQNLAPEDCEEIIQMSATNLGTPYSQYTGYGRLNAGKALRLIQGPYRDLRHFGANSQFSNTKSVSMVDSNITITITERYQNEAGTWFPFGSYKVDVYEISSVVQHTLGANDTIMKLWPRHSSSSLFPSPQGVYVTLREKIEIDNSTSTSCTMKGYVYNVRSTSGTPLGWWPRDTTNLDSLKMEYSILTRNTSVTDNFSINEEKTDGSDIYVFPNPGEELQNIVIKNNGNNMDVHIDIIDIAGKKVKEVYKGKLSSGIHTIPVFIGDLTNSVYIYRIKNNIGYTYIKFIKQ